MKNAQVYVKRPPPSGLLLNDGKVKFLSDLVYIFTNF